MRRLLYGSLAAICGAWLLLVPVGGQQYFPPISSLPNLSTLLFGATATATVQGTLTTSTTQVCTTAVTTEETLWSYTLPAASLDTDGRGIRISMWGTTGATANLKTERLYFGATVVHIRNAAADNGAGWRMTADVLRASATTQVSSAFAIIGTGGSFSNTSSHLQNAPVETLANAVIIKLTGQNGTAAANDICIKAAIVETLR